MPLKYACIVVLKKSGLLKVAIVFVSCTSSRLDCVNDLPHVSQNNCAESP